MKPPDPAACLDTRWSVLRVAGGDAIPFLHGQLSSDVESLRPGSGQYWSYNSPKGRVLANGVLWRAPASDGITMLVAADLAEAIRKRLSMFVLRAKATIEDAGRAATLIGIAGDGAAQAVRDAFGPSLAPGAAAAFGRDAQAFMLPDRRVVVVAPQAQGPVLQAALARHAPWVGNDEWRWFGIAAGVPWITAATSDLFIPQTLNFDLLGGVSFTKGCYPGQEIVARMQYLGRLKERMFAFHVDGDPPAPATRVLAGDDNVGAVVNAAAAPAGGSELLAAVSVAARDTGALRLADGRAITDLSLPYEIPAPTAPNRVKL